MNTAHWSRDHPVACFIALTYALSWPLFVLVLWVLPESMLLQGSLGTLAVFAPAISAMIVAGRADPERLPAGGRARLTSFLVGWVISWIVLVVTTGVLRQALGPGIIAFNAFLSLLPAFVISRAFSPTRGVRDHFRSLLFPRGNPLWYVFAFLAVPAVQLAGYGITVLLQGGDGSVSREGVFISPVSALVYLAYGLFFAGGINEESGWRGFALPRLQRRLCPLQAGLVVWFFWALWHLPTDLASGDPASAILMNRLFFNLVWSILLMWVFNRTGGSILAPVLFHPSVNAVGRLLPRTDAAAVIFAMLGVLAVVVNRMWRRLPDSHPAIR